VHAVPQPPLAPPPSPLITDDALDVVGRAILQEVSEELRETSGDEVPVATLAVHGEPGAVLPNAAAEGSLIVLQHRDLSRLQRVVSGSTVASVAAHARCPVVAVPPRTRAQAGSHTLTVGVHEDGSRPEVLEAAFAEAALHGWSLRVCHSWRLASAYEDAFFADESWLRRIEKSLRSACETIALKYPDVRLEVDVRYDFPADVLVDLSATSAMVVLGRHGRRGPLPARVGSLARTVVAHARCPVMVMPV
jgi:nucleotide-binding universal stress UspA family protein